MSQSSAELRGLLERIFEDSFVEPKERDELVAAKAGLPESEVLAVFKKFLNDKWGEAIADDVITGPERALLARIVSELGLSMADLPHQAQMALRDHFSRLPTRG